MRHDTMHWFVIVMASSRLIGFVRLSSFKTSAFASAGLLFGRPEWVSRGAIELLSLEDDYRLQNGALSFEDDSPFRPPEASFCQNGQNGSPEGR